MKSGAMTRRALGLALAAAPWALSAAATPIDTPLSAEDQALVSRASAYLQGLGEVKGRFEQTDARGDVSTGLLYLKRPGRARFAYDPPSNLVVISDGATVLVRDPRLKSENRYPLGATPLALFLAKQIRLDRGVAVRSVDRIPGGYSLTAYDARHPAQGEILLGFSDDPVALREWRLTDGQGRTTQVRLSDLTPASGLDPNLFFVPPPIQRAGSLRF